jgi:hypothetical protein
MAVTFALTCAISFFYTSPSIAANTSNMSAPQVLVLIWAGAGWTDLVSVNYDGTVIEKNVREDIDAISKGTGWAVNNLHISTKKIPVPGANLSTSATFETNTSLASGSATVYIDPIVLAFKRMDRLQISILVGKTTSINAPDGFTDDKVSIAGVYNPGNIQYVVKITDHTITQLDWPNHQAYQATGKTIRHTGRNFLVIISLASIGAIIAYFTTRKLTRK